MAKDSTIEYINTYKEIAKEQMKKYGIPASITLSQAILESSSGKSQLSKNFNNHFGIKATSSWIKQGGKYSIFKDDKEDDKFKSYKDVKDSFEDHSLLLLNKRYKNCFSLNCQDYSLWAKEIKKAGYATDKDYEKKLINLIETYHLDRFDFQAIKEAKKEQKQIGYLKEKDFEMEKDFLKEEHKNYSFPLEKQTTLFVTSLWGTRKDPLNSGKTQNHQGIDFRANFEPIIATEDNGRVSAINSDASSSGGKSISIDYKREDGSSIRVTYMHLSKIDVKLGQQVNAGQKIGVSGNSGKRTTGAHLHFQVSKITDSYRRNYDPIAYLEEIAKKGDIKTSIEYNGKNLLSSYRIDETKENPLNLQDWMKKLLLSEDSNLNLFEKEDPLMDIIVSIFSSLMALTLKDETKEKQKYEKVNLAVESKKEDLSNLIESPIKMGLEIKDKKGAILRVKSEDKEYSLLLNQAELKDLYNTLKSEQLTKKEKANYILEIVKSKENHDLINNMAKENFESLLLDKTQKETLSIK